MWIGDMMKKRNDYTPFIRKKFNSIIIPSTLETWKEQKQKNVSTTQHDKGNFLKLHCSQNKISIIVSGPFCEQWPIESCIAYPHVTCCRLLATRRRSTRPARATSRDAHRRPSLSIPLLNGPHSLPLRTSGQRMLHHGTQAPPSSSHETSTQPH